METGKAPGTERSKTHPDRFWSYRRLRVLDFHPGGTLRWWLLFLLLLVLAVDQFQRFMIGSVLVYVLQDFQVTLTDYGRVGIISSFLAMAASYFLSNAADRYSRRTLIAYLILADAVASAFMAFSSSFVQLGIGIILGGMIGAGLVPALSAIISDLSPRSGRAFAFAFLSLAYTAGLMLANAASSAMIPIWPGWRPEYWLGSAVGLVTLILFILFYRELPRAPAGNLPPEASESRADGLTRQEADLDGRKVYRDWRIWVLALAMICWGVAYAGLASFIPTFLVQHHGLKPQAGSAQASIFWLIYSLGALFTGRLSDRWQVRKTLVAGGAVCTGGLFLALALLPKGIPPSTITIILALFGLCASFIYPAFTALFSENAEEVSPHGVARAFGIMGLMWPLGGILMNLGVPYAVAHYGWPVWIGFSGIMCLLIAVLVAFGRGPWRKPRISAAAPAAQGDD